MAKKDEIKEGTLNPNEGKLKDIKMPEYTL